MAPTATLAHRQPAWTMVVLEICGIPVEFPFQPYDSQVVYMEKVLVALTTKQNAILESPTGTGKTLCLLCATLAWRRHVKRGVRANPTTQPLALAYEGGDNEDQQSGEGGEHGPQLPRIIYSSRTHSQLKQVVQELKNTSYRPSVAVLGSREHLCVNEKISQMRGTRQNFACRAAVKARKCVYKHGFDAVKGRKANLEILDIEELVNMMKEKQVCPFFLSRLMLPEADIIFVPYNYLIDPLARRSIGISLENAVLIFDEAHNVESIASDAASYALSSNDITGCVSEVQQFINALTENRIHLPPSSSLSVESAETLKALLLEIDKGLNTFPLSSSGGYTKPGEFIFEFFQQFNVNFETCPLVLNMVEEVIELLNQGNDQRTAASKLDALLSFLGTIFRNKEKHAQAAKNYRVHIQETRDRLPTNAPRLFNSPRGSKTTRVFNYWCFHPGVAFQEIVTNNVYNIILTSGTLSPLQTTIKELGIEFPVQLENNHVIDASQVWVGVVGRGVTGKKLNSSYASRSTEEYLLELGNTIVNFARLVPNGLLVFFPSYSILEESIERWRKHTNKESPTPIWDRLIQLKDLFVEPRGRLDFKAVVDEYHETIKSKPSGAIFFAVCRGKVSEGIDFSNEKGRAVVITGLPFPPTKDPKIILKKSILDDAVVPHGEMKLTGNNWYIQQASRAVNQAIGRVIRHRHDFGAIILCDERFGLQQQQKCLSQWLQPFCRTYQTYGEAHVGLLRFFKSNQTTLSESSTVKLIPGPISKPFKSPVVLEQQHDDRPMEQMTSQHDLVTGIGDGQSYVDPSLLRPQPLENRKTDLGPPKSLLQSSLPLSRAPQVQNKKRSLGSVFASSRSSMVQSTSSISRPFVPPRPQGQMETSRRDHNSLGVDSADSAPHSAHSDAVAAFPAVARRLLTSGEVATLYSLIRRLQKQDSVDDSLEEICKLLQRIERRELLTLMPQVLNSAIRERFVQKLAALGIAMIDAPPGHSSKVSASNSTSANSGITNFFERLQQNKRRRQVSSEQAAAVVKDPQCFVCYEITRKAYASKCGHICCLPCWQKMEKDGFTACPMCKVPFKLDQLSLIRAAKSSASVHQRDDTRS